ncbi:hypothetical protein [Lichenifustis flavocetrariae]|nr:hypothetical protein [Lichenifustis flavocetrariae]
MSKEQRSNKEKKKPKKDKPKAEAAVSPFAKGQTGQSTSKKG